MCYYKLFTFFTLALNANTDSFIEKLAIKSETITKTSIYTRQMNTAIPVSTQTGTSTACRLLYVCCASVYRHEIAINLGAVSLRPAVTNDCSLGVRRRRATRLQSGCEAQENHTTAVWV